MNSSNGPAQRTRRKTATGTETIDRKRKARHSTGDEARGSKKRLSHQPPSKNKEMTLESIELFDDNFEKANCLSKSCELLGSNSCAPKNESKRRNLRSARNGENRKHVQKETLKLSGRPQTPTELINGMTNFTFSNYFTPVSNDNSPLPLLTWADSNEVWENMLKKDREYKRDSLYIRKHPSLQPRMRSVLLDWLIEVCEVHRLHRETFYLAVDFVDRYLSSQSDLPKTRLQLVGVTALFIAAKIEEIYPPKLSEFAYVTDGACTENEILQQELILIQALEWKLSPVTPVCWVTAYLQIANRRLKSGSKENIDENFQIPSFSAIHLCRVTELIDLCCLDTGYLQFSYSIIAASALYHMWGKGLTEITGHEFDELFPCIQWLSPFANVICKNQAKPLKKFEKIPKDDSHNIQVHNNGVQLLDVVHNEMSTILPLNNLQKNSPVVHCKSLLTPPHSTEKDT